MSHEPPEAFPRVVERPKNPTLLRLADELSDILDRLAGPDDGFRDADLDHAKRLVRAVREEA
jgi:hypothetical protein